MNRDILMKYAGKMIVVYYLSDDKECFAIGWFYALDVGTLRLKVTSTRFETYESIEVNIDSVRKIEDYQHD